VESEGQVSKGATTNKLEVTNSPVDAKLDMAEIDELRDVDPATDRINAERFGFQDKRIREDRPVVTNKSFVTWLLEGIKKIKR
jgi:hypothetical protein